MRINNTSLFYLLWNLLCWQKYNVSFISTGNMAQKVHWEQIRVISVSLKFSSVITMLTMVSDQGPHLSSRFLISKMQCYCKDEFIYYLTEHAKKAIFSCLRGFEGSSSTVYFLLTLKGILYLHLNSSLHTLGLDIILFVVCFGPLWKYTLW